MNSGVLTFDSTGCIDERAVADFPLPHFNGGTPTDNNNLLVGATFASGYNAEAWVAGLPYTAGGALLVDFFGAITHYAPGGIPITSNGAVAVDAGPARSWLPGGIPISIVGKVCISVNDPPLQTAFSDGFSDGFQ